VLNPDAAQKAAQRRLAQALGYPAAVSFSVMLNSAVLAVASVLALSGFKRFLVASPASVFAGILRQQSFSRWLALCSNHRLGFGFVAVLGPNIVLNLARSARWTLRKKPRSAG
jgi:hypothetical protein